MIPKFRVWDTVKKSMREVQAIVYTVERVYPVYSEVFRRYVPFSEAILMQSTGLFDVNGKEIFEGDVVKLRYTISSDYEFFKVTRFRGGSWRIDNRRRGCELWLRNEECEIIGNIYENPELVEGSS
ncbi:TPA: YopX family protein [Streptococcus suis]